MIQKQSYRPLSLKKIKIYIYYYTEYMFNQIIRILHFSQKFVNYKPLTTLTYETDIINL